jgi:16S rRNA processing protein RimM
LLVGEILRAHGIRGEVAVRPLTENPDRFRPGARLAVGPEPDQAREMVVASVRTHQGRLLVAFDPPLDRTAAEALRGERVFAPAGDLPEAPEGAFWERDLVGLAVVDTTGRPLGVVTGVLGRAEQDLWEIDTPGGAVLLPAAKDLVVVVDLAARRLTVDPPAGLFPGTP